MESSTEILDISSDEEVDFGDTTDSSDFGVGGGEYEDVDYSLLSKLLGDIGGNKENENDSDSDSDSDEVLLVNKVLPKAPKTLRIEPLKPSTKVVGDESDDDDCVILDDDPDKPVVMASGNADAAAAAAADDDDLKIVGEKGEVACRDFPHPRHLCVRFPFASTRHALYCGQCHCYVCDSPAPCSEWGTGFSIVDHCHATDEDDFWRAERKRMKKGGRPLPIFPSIRGASPLEAPIQTIQVPVLAPPHLNSLLQNQSLSTVTNHPHPVSSNVNVSNAVNQARIHPSLCVVPSHEPQSQFSLQSQPTSNSNVASGDQIHNVGSRSFQSFPPRAVFKQPGLVGASLNNRHSYGSQLSSDPSLQRCHSFQAPALNGTHGLTQQSGGSGSDHSAFHQPKISSPQSTDVSCAKYPPSQPQIHSEPYTSCLFRDPRHSQMPSQPYVNRTFVNAVPLQPQVAPNPSVKNFENLVLPQPYVAFEPDSPLPSQTLSSYQSADSGFGDQLHTRSMVSSHSHLASGFPSQSSQLQIHANPTSLFVDGQNEMRQGNRTQNGIDASLTDFIYPWDSPVNHGNPQIHAEVFPQCQGAAPAGNSQLQSIAKDNYRQSMAPQDNFHPQTVAVADNSSLSYNTHSQFPGSRKPLKLQLDDWTFGSHSLPEGFEVMSPVWNASSR
ncbi:UNVERIFIED_CONTAM: hypothetical protein Slati_0561400 [Sesamum latifolium]|uniref:RPM1 interacting protein 13 n=1 Tax=Sesamum latifolium TaxID=2727402 RepID=A0AAW2XYW9_9LAMI